LADIVNTKAPFVAFKGLEMKREKTKLWRVLVFLFGFAVCVAGTGLAWPGSYVDGHFYSYPVTGRLLTVVAVWWLLVLGTTFFVMKRIGRKACSEGDHDQ
jgi:hypothetical protein